MFVKLKYYLKGHAVTLQIQKAIQKRTTLEVMFNDTIWTLNQNL